MCHIQEYSYLQQNIPKSFSFSMQLTLIFLLLLLLDVYENI